MKIKNIFISLLVCLFCTGQVAAFGYFDWFAKASNTRKCLYAGLGLTAAVGLYRYMQGYWPFSQKNIELNNKPKNEQEEKKSEVLKLDKDLISVPITLENTKESDKALIIIEELQEKDIETVLNLWDQDRRDVGYRYNLFIGDKNPKDVFKLFLDRVIKKTVDTQSGTKCHLYVVKENDEIKSYMASMEGHGLIEVFCMSIGKGNDTFNYLSGAFNHFIEKISKKSVQGVHIMVHRQDKDARDYFDNNVGSMFVADNNNKYDGLFDKKAYWLACGKQGKIEITMVEDCEGIQKYLDDMAFQYCKLHYPGGDFKKHMESFNRAFEAGSQRFTMVAIDRNKNMVGFIMNQELIENKFIYGPHMLNIYATHPQVALAILEKICAKNDLFFDLKIGNKTMKQAFKDIKGQFELVRVAVASK